MSVGWARVILLLPRPLTVTASPPQQNLAVTTASSRQRRSLTSRGRSRAALSAATPTMQSPLGVRPVSLVISRVVGWSAVTQGCPLQRMVTRATPVMGGLPGAGPLGSTRSASCPGESPLSVFVPSPLLVVFALERHGPALRHLPPHLAVEGCLERENEVSCECE